MNKSEIPEKWCINMKEKTFPRKMRVGDGFECHIIAEIHAYVPTLNSPWIDKHGVAWRNAEEIEDLPEIAGYEGKIENDYIIYGCVKFFIPALQEFTTQPMPKGQEIASIKLSSGIEITKHQLDNIVNYWREIDTI